MKKLQKSEMVRRGQVDHVKAERNVLTEVRCAAPCRCDRQPKATTGAACLLLGAHSNQPIGGCRCPTRTS